MKKKTSLKKLTVDCGSQIEYIKNVCKRKTRSFVSSAYSRCEMVDELMNEHRRVNILSSMGPKTEPNVIYEIRERDEVDFQQQMSKTTSMS